MSIKIINDVFDNSEMKGNDRLVMLSIADNADDEKRQAWPSVTNIAHKTRIPIRTVWRCIKRCVASGELAIIRHGSKDGGSNLYQIMVERSSRVGHKRGSDKMTGAPPNGIPPLSPLAHPPMPVHGTPPVPPNGTLTVIEPSVQPSSEKQVASKNVWRIKTIMEAKQKLADQLKHQNSSETANGRRWSSELARARFKKLSQEIKELNESLASM